MTGAKRPSLGTVTFLNVPLTSDNLLKSERSQMCFLFFLPPIFEEACMILSYIEKEKYNSELTAAQRFQLPIRKMHNVGLRTAENETCIENSQG